MKPTTSPLAALLSVALLPALWSCQSHELEPIDPGAWAVPKVTEVITTKLPPKVMLVVDRSGSMDGTKWDSVVRAITDANTGMVSRAEADKIRYGLAVFPKAGTSNSCQAGGVVVPLRPNPGETTAEIRNQLTTVITPSGGTPSAATMRVVLGEASFAVEPDRNRFAILLTDGLPNCNEAFASSCAAGVSCVSSDPIQTPNPCDGNATMCLDDVELVGAVGELARAGVPTFVIGFGAGAATPEAVRVLDAAAEAGGNRRSATSPKYYQASNQAELEEVLAAIRVKIVDCSFLLNPAPENPTLFEAVLIDLATNEETRVPAAEVELAAGSTTATIGGAACDRIKAAAPNTLAVEFRYANKL